MGLAPLPGGVRPHVVEGRHEPLVRVGGDHGHPPQAAVPQRAHERGPALPRLGVGEGEPEHLLAPGAVEADGHEQRPRPHPVAAADLQVGRARHREGVGARLERAPPEVLGRRVERGAGGGHRLPRELPAADLTHDLADLGGGDAAHHHLGHRGHEGGLAPPVALEDHRLERGAAVPGDPEHDGAGPGREPARAGAVAAVGARLAPLVAPRPELLVGLRAHHGVEGGSEHLPEGAPPRSPRGAVESRPGRG